MIVGSLRELAVVFADYDDFFIGLGVMYFRIVVYIAVFCDGFFDKRVVGASFFQPARFSSTLFASTTTQVRFRRLLKFAMLLANDGNCRI